eukprot:CAMPEP_0194143844 /NCGR_PEP_ID=MMETSP0152-20130528/12955_1 /TAXON_ID=1049557 /ORGANISM="Thalassiothrix antarctica, Strain L6-D1" /LENGTH=82 /DNA_ID=CAMNT_0038843433 /DNA_START=210 /DNA_END=458 /DNA_ORIENTATION=+
MVTIDALDRLGLKWDPPDVSDVMMEEYVTESELDFLATEVGMDLPEWDRTGEARMRLLMQDEDDDMFLDGDGNSDNDGPVLL